MPVKSYVVVVGQRQDEEHENVSKHGLVLIQLTMEAHTVTIQVFEGSGIQGL